MKDLVRKAQCGDEFEIASAATTSEEIWNGTGNPVYPPARRVLMEHGIGIPGNELGVAAKRACLLKRSDYAHYDRIIGMDAENMQDMQRILGGDPYRKLSLLMDYTKPAGKCLTRGIRGTSMRLGETHTKAAAGFWMPAGKRRERYDSYWLSPVNFKGVCGHGQ